MADKPDARIVTWVEAEGLIPGRRKWWVMVGFWTDGGRPYTVGADRNCDDVIRVGPFPNRGDAMFEMRGQLRARILDEVSGLRRLGGGEVVAMALEGWTE